MTDVHSVRVLVELLAERQRAAGAARRGPVVALRAVCATGRHRLSSRSGVCPFCAMGLPGR